MKRVFLAVALFILVGCSTTQLGSKDPKVVAEKICLNNDGRGRLTVNQKKYVFTYFSALENDDAKWVLGLSFPFQEEEIFELDWSENSKMKFNTSIDSKILKENTNINPQELDRFINAIGSALKDVINLKQKSDDTKIRYNWIVEKQALIGTGLKDKMKIVFDNYKRDEYFGLIELEFESGDKQAFKFEFIVNQCFEKDLKA